MLARVTVLHDCLGCRTFELPPSAAVGDVKARIEAETDFPCAEQRLWHRGRQIPGHVIACHQNLEEISKAEILYWGLRWN